MIANQQSRSAVVDIGSNSVRMVVFDRDDRSLEPIFNEKAMSGLGRDLLATGRLHAAGRTSALAILARFRLIAERLDVSSVRAVATAAAREAKDGAAFIVQAEAALGAPIDVISGEEEGRLSALGVICGIAGADGVVGDLGGGSLELADIRNGEVGRCLSLPIGPLALGEVVGRRGESRRIQAGLEAAPAGLAKGRALYIVGGAWRSLAKLYFERKRHPIRIINAFELPGPTARDFARSVGRTRPSGLAKLKGVSSRRRANTPYSARLLAQLIDRLKPERVVFSGYGLREGVEYEQMDERVRVRDPLLDHCRKLGLAGARAPFNGDRLAEWAVEAFDMPPASERLIRAAAWLSDMSGADHPDYRGQHAAARALHLASAGVGHSERVFLAAAVYARYHGFGMESALGRAAALLSAEDRRQATALGMAFRLAHAIEPGDGVDGSGELRNAFRLKREPGRLCLTAENVDADILGETALRRLTSLAKALNVEAVVVDSQSAAA